MRKYDKIRVKESVTFGAKEPGYFCTDNGFAITRDGDDFTIKCLATGETREVHVSNVRWSEAAPAIEQPVTAARSMGPRLVQKDTKPTAT